VPTVDARRLGRVAVALAGAAGLLLVVIAALGPSAAEPGLGPRHGVRGLLPSYSLHVHPSSAVVTLLLVLAYVAGGLAVGAGLLAVRAGHRLDPRRALLAGLLFALAAVLVPPIGSADHINYAAYGRIAVQGGDPYVEPPATWHGGRDPVTSAVLPPWRTTPSIYGPVATAVQAGTSALGGDSLRATVWFGQVVCALAWLLVGWLLVRFTSARAGDGSPAMSRALWLWLLNPVLYGVVLLGAHVDLPATAFALLALLLAARRPGWAGLALGVAIGTKLTLVLALVAVVWGLRHLGRRAGTVACLRLVAGAAVVLVPAHLWAGRHVFDQLRHARIYVSLADPWRPVVDALSGPVGHQAVRHWVVLLAPIPVLALAAVLCRVVRPAANLRPPDRAGLEPAHEQVVADAAVAFVVLGAAYVLFAPYVLPWYDASVWAPLALVAGGALDAVLLVRLVAYAVAYVPGLVNGLSPTVHDVTLGYRRQVTPYVGWLAVLAVVALALRRRPGRRPRVR
jgi:hypothetical protein